MIVPAAGARPPVSVDPARFAESRKMLRAICPHTPDELHGYIRAVLGFDIPRVPLSAFGMAAPFDYLQHAFFESEQPRDCVVWANRGGGKTQLGAIATFLDILFKPGIQIRILGGSFEQSSKMYAYLRKIAEREEFRDLIAGRMTGRRIELTNGAVVEVLAQSEQSVRGQRVQKIRCDEVELFIPEIWQAVQFTTRSARCGEIHVPGSIEAFSTMHRPFGLMAKLIDESDPQRRRVFRWGILETLAHCPSARACDTCALQPECQGRAKQGRGFISIEDALQQKGRTSPQAWAAEMLCQRPSRSDCVYPEFDLESHVQDCDPKPGRADQLLFIGGMDFGFRNPTVKLWGYVRNDPLPIVAQNSSASLISKPTLCIVDEYSARERTMAEHIRVLRERPWPTEAWIGIDPAGYQRHESSGTSSAALLNRAGFHLRARRLDLRAGIEAVRCRFRSADGNSAIIIHPRCTQLIKALQQYHYPPDQPEAVHPVKDGADHICDALRYLIINLERGSHRARIIRYT